MPDVLASPPHVDVAVLRGVRRALDRPVPVGAARALSTVGEHAAGWTLVALSGALLRPAERRPWLEAGAVVLASHATSVVLKRVVRRPRPDLADAPPLVGTPSRLSFPSSHATSTTAAAVVLTPLLGRSPAARAVAVALVAAMGTSRVLLGVHYPSDVLAGSALGGATALGARRLLRGHR
ncbi:phosphatase PAP2 family protein [uncultured Pseudokineococcus sp.]|uniref:phosphatase PAP2 family protein n=1 Tax=uncultured Pseudokineococcus sp. TaxID=1642928 RepID=UPI00261692C6|nr:phosphatase PAP2 family protein [uncultured Pseudokineococcus sp.]